MKLIFLEENCYHSGFDLTNSEMAARLNALALEYNDTAGILSVTFPDNFKRAHVSVGDVDGTEEYLVPILEDSEIQLNETQMSMVHYFFVRAVNQDGTYLEGRAYLSTTSIEGTFIYPTGRIDFGALPVTMVGFAGHQMATDYTHIQMMLSVVHDDGTPGGSGFVWMSDKFDKDIDIRVPLDVIAGMCEGKQLANINVLYNFFAPDETGNLIFVKYLAIGDATNAVTFTVVSDVVEEVLSVVSLGGKVYCLDPVIMQINRHRNRDIQNVRVEISNYIADFEFYPDRNLLEIDIAEYLQTLWANVDVFSYQKTDATVIVKIYDADWNHLETHSLNVVVVYGQNPESEIPDNLRVQWLDKFGALHDVTFKVFQNVAEGESKRKYVSKGIEHEEKSGERSLSLAYVNANASQRIALETIVFADHVRAYMSGTWKRVKVANTYKNGTGREKRNFEITIKYAI